jgi:hypothetical protein
MTPQNKARLLAAIGSRAMRLLIATLRFRLNDRASVFEMPVDQPPIWVFWHNRFFVVPYLFERYFPRVRGAALTSASKDGEILAAFLERFGIRPVRGSSSRGGARALVEMRRAVEDGYCMGITPDGPRGPRYRLNPGVVKLAQITGRAILPVRIGYSRYWQLKSWDAFMIPKPFAEVRVRFDPLHRAAPTTSEEAFEMERARLELLLGDEG